MPLRPSCLPFLPGRGAVRRPLRHPLGRTLLPTRENLSKTDKTLSSGGG